MSQRSEHAEAKRADKREYLKIIIKTSLFFLFFIPAVFLLAGRIDYWQGWVFIGIMAFQVAVILARFSDRMDLIRERMRPGPGIKRWDRIFSVFYGPLSLSVIIVAILDAGRFRWTGGLPPWVCVASAPVLIASGAIITWAMLVNRWFSSVVRIQADRAQRVVRDGPYRFIRHPGYAAGILTIMSIPPVLGSLWGLVPAGIVTLLVIIRTSLEDETLKNELAGYADYAREVRYRLLSRVW